MHVTEYSLDNYKKLQDHNFVVHQRAKTTLFDPNFEHDVGMWIGFALCERNKGQRKLRKRMLSTRVVLVTFL